MGASAADSAQDAEGGRRSRGHRGHGKRPWAPQQGQQQPQQPSEPQQRWRDAWGEASAKGWGASSSGGGTWWGSAWREDVSRPGSSSSPQRDAAWGAGSGGGWPRGWAWDRADGGERPDAGPVEEPVEEDFAGACGAARSVRAPSAEFRCDFCQQLFTFMSDIARCEVHGDHIKMHKRSDTERIFEGMDHVAHEDNYSGVTQLKDICYRCFGRKEHGNEEYYVAAEDPAGGTTKVLRVWKRLSDQSRNAPGPKTAAKHLQRIQARVRELQETDPDKAATFETLCRIIENKAAARSSDWVSWVGPPELGVVML